MKEVIPRLPVLRSEVREYAQYRQSITKEAINQGKNAYQVDRNISREFSDHTKAWSDADKFAYLEMLAEESVASNKLTQSNPASQVKRESESANIVGNLIIWISIICAAIAIPVLGQVEVASGYYSSRTVFVPAIVAFCVASGFSGVLLGYLFKKIASILRHLENKAS